MLVLLCELPVVVQPTQKIAHVRKSYRQGIMFI